MNLVRLGGVLTLGLMAGFVIVMRRRDIARARGEARLSPYVRWDSTFS